MLNIYVPYTYIYVYPRVEFFIKIKDTLEFLLSEVEKCFSYGSDDCETCYFRNETKNISGNILM